MLLLTTKDLARDMGLHPRTVKRWWKRLKVKPDACAGNGCHRWTPAAYARLLKRWKAYWEKRGRARGRSVSELGALYSGRGKPRGKPGRAGGWSRRAPGKFQMRFKLLF